MLSHVVGSPSTGGGSSRSGQLWGVGLSPQGAAYAAAVAKAPATAGPHSPSAAQRSSSHPPHYDIQSGTYNTRRRGGDGSSGSGSNSNNNSNTNSYNHNRSSSSNSHSGAPERTAMGSVSTTALAQFVSPGGAASVGGDSASIAASYSTPDPPPAAASPYSSQVPRTTAIQSHIVPSPIAAHSNYYANTAPSYAPSVASYATHDPPASASYHPAAAAMDRAPPPPPVPTIPFPTPVAPPQLPTTHQHGQVHTAAIGHILAQMSAAMVSVSPAVQHAQRKLDNEKKKKTKEDRAKLLREKTEEEERAQKAAAVQERLMLKHSIIRARLMAKQARMTAKALKAAARTANRELGSANYGATDVSTTGIADTIHRAKAIARAARAAAEVAQQQADELNARREDGGSQDGRYYDEGDDAASYYSEPPPPPPRPKRGGPKRRSPRRRSSAGQSGGGRSRGGGGRGGGAAIDKVKKKAGLMTRVFSWGSKGGKPKEGKGSGKGGQSGRGGKPSKGQRKARRMQQLDPETDSNYGADEVVDDAYSDYTGWH